jgi:16S rRNA (cytosine967-C5)-methyltransferase
MIPAARLSAAIDLISDIEQAEKRPADAVANDFFRARRFIGGGDRRAVSDRAWDVIRNRRKLGWWLAKADAPTNPGMLVAGSLLLEGWTADGVAQSYSGGKYAPPSLTPAEKAALAKLEGHTADHPDMPAAVRLEIPDWLLPLLQKRFGNTLWRELEALAAPAPLDLRVNLLKTDRAAARAALLDEGIEATPTTLSPWGLRVPGRKSITAGKAFQDGLVEIQDEGSQLVAALVNAGPGMTVVDWCAGAGGKTLALAMTMQNRGKITACDVSASRLDAAVRRLRRAGVHNAERHLVEPGDKWAKRHAAAFDRVLVDAPCTGTGTWRRNPDARLRLSETDLAELLPKQAAILDTAARLTRVGGWLVYATCSLLPQENEAQVDAFLMRNPGYEVLPLQQVWGMNTPPPGDGPYLSLTPRQYNTDGFFTAVLVRRA